jgi:hypothetical protein
MTRTLVKIGAMAVDNHTYPVRYFALQTPHGGCRYSAEIIVGPGDRVILDGDSVINLEVRAWHVMPATVYSRTLAKRAAAREPRPALSRIVDQRRCRRAKRSANEGR